MTYSKNNAITCVFFIHHISRIGTFHSSIFHSLQAVNKKLINVYTLQSFKKQTRKRWNISFRIKSNLSSINYLS